MQVAVLLLVILLLYAPLDLPIPLLDDNLIKVKVKMPGKLTPFLAYTFIPKNLNIEYFKERGNIPWWSQKGIWVSFLRPIPSMYLFVLYRIAPYYVIYFLGFILFWFALLIIRLILIRNGISSILSTFWSLVFATLTINHLTVIWPAAVNDLFGLIFILAGFHFFKLALKKPIPLYTVSVILFLLLAGLSKETYLFAPIWFIAYIFLLHKYKFRSVRKIFFILLGLLFWNTAYFSIYKLLGFGVNSAYYISIFNFYSYLHYALPSLFWQALMPTMGIFYKSSLKLHWIISLVGLSGFAFLLVFLLGGRKFLYALLLVAPVLFIVPRNMALRLFTVSVALAIVSFVPLLRTHFPKSKKWKIILFYFIVVGIMGHYLQTVLLKNMQEENQDLLVKLSKMPQDAIIFIIGNPSPGIVFGYDAAFKDAYGRESPLFYHIHPGEDKVLIKINRGKLIVKGSCQYTISSIFRKPSSSELFSGQTGIFKAKEIKKGVIQINLQPKVDKNKIWIFLYKNRKYKVLPFKTLLKAEK